MNLLDRLFGREQNKEHTGEFCGNCGSPMSRRTQIVLRYDTKTGQPIYGHGKARCSRDEFCGRWGMPGF